MHDKRMRALVLALLVSLSSAVFGQKPIRFVVPFPAGALPDQIARALAPALQDALGQPFVVENKPGAIGVVGTAEAARAAPDGHTIVMTTNSTLAAAGALFKKLQYDPVKDFAPIMLISRTSMILLVRPDFPAESFFRKIWAHFVQFRFAHVPIAINRLERRGDVAQIVRAREK